MYMHIHLHACVHVYVHIYMHCTCTCTCTCHTQLSPSSPHTSSHMLPQTTLHSSPEHPPHPHNQQTGTNTDADTRDSGSDGGNNTEGLKGVGESQERGKMRSEEKQEPNKLSQDKGGGKEKRRYDGIDHELITDPEASGVKPQVPQKLSQPRENSRLGKAATESEPGLPAHHLPPLRTGAGMVLPPDQPEGLGHESREEQLVRKETHDPKIQENDEVEEEESIEEEAISSSHSSPEMGTPSTSTPLKAVPPHSSSGSTSGRLEPPLPPPLSSSLSAIVEPHSTESGMKTKENGGRDVRGGGSVGGGGFVMMGGGGEGVGSSEDGDSVSVTVTEMSDEGDEDTMFEETLPQYTTGVDACAVAIYMYMGTATTHTL